MSKETLRTTSIETPTRLTRRGKLAAWAIGISTAAGVTIFGVHEYNQSQEPDFSEDTFSHMVVPGETAWDLASSVKGADKFDHRKIVDHIMNDPRNKDVFEDGKLDQGEVVELSKTVR